MGDYGDLCFTELLSSVVLQLTGKTHILEKQRGSLLIFLGCFSTEATKTYLFYREEIVSFNNRN